MSKKFQIKIEPDANIHDDYFQYTKEYVAKYGTQVIVLLQVGAFFEVYGVKETATGNIIGSSILEFSEICQLNISEKRFLTKMVKL